MTEKTDDALKKYFAGRTEVPAYIQARVSARIHGSQEVPEKPPLFVFGIVAFDFVVSFAILYIIWVLAGAGLVFYSAAAFAVISLFWAVTITLVSGQATKGESL
jgi:hypothetical protein